MSSPWIMIGVPTSAGAHHAGQDQAPAALRQAGLLDRLRAAGVDIEDAGDLPGAVFEVDHEHPGARSLDAVARVAREVADAVAAQLDAGQPNAAQLDAGQPNAAQLDAGQPNAGQPNAGQPNAGQPDSGPSGGRRPLIVGGDCTITLGVIAGFRRSHPDVGLAYLDGEADLGTPGSDGAGIFDAMGVAHLLGRGAPELTELGGPAPLLTPDRLALVGGDPRETNADSRRFLAETGVSFQEGPALRADPAGTARRALAAIAPASGPVVVHFDVDVVDSGDLPLGNFPSYGSGLELADAVACLRGLVQDPACAALVLTEVNPTYDPSGRQLGRYIDGVVAALAD
jgi:arginase